MAKSWFDQFDDTPTAVFRPIDVDRPVKPVVRRRVVAPQASAKTSTISIPTMALMVACGVGIGGIGIAALVLGVGGDDEAPPQPAAVELSASPSGSLVSADRAVGVTGDFAATGAQVDIDAEASSSLRGAIVVFETVYYSQDADGVLDTVAAGSGLAATDWETVLPKAAPNGVSWCAVMRPELGQTVDIDLTVTDPAGEVTTYPQTIRGEKMAG
ncbi:hypothetical protein [Corynebacterium sp. CCM 9204]|uniref:hypothetical protein n=1 Tax=Corynebacterium sp. CCM 9204 TaxID=3057616 RepID=UPI003524EB93